MKVSDEFNTIHNGKIQIAKNTNGGNSSWGEKEDYSEDSIRLAGIKRMEGLIQFLPQNYRFGD